MAAEADCDTPSIQAPMAYPTHPLQHGLEGLDDLKNYEAEDQSYKRPPTPLRFLTECK